jgi:hypothetical protein
MARSKSISIPITGTSAPLRKELKKAQAELSAFGKAQAQWAQASSLAYGVVGSAAAQFAISSVRAALDDQKSQALLAQQLIATTGARQAQIDGVEKYITATMMATNITDDQLRPALAQLVRVTGSASEAQDLLTLAANVSVGAQRELGSVVTALGRAYNGNYGALTKLGITIDETAVQSRGFAAVTDELTAKFGGSAQAATETLAGRVENLGIRFGELQETLGTLLLPAVDDATTKLLDLAKAVDSGDVSDLGSSIFNLAGGIKDLAFTITGVGIAQGLSPLNWWLNQTGGNVDSLAGKYQALSNIIVTATNQANAAAALEDQAEAAARADRQVGYLKDQYKGFSEVILDQADAQKEAAKRIGGSSKASEKDTKAKKKQRKETKDTGDTLQKSLAKGVEVANERLSEARTLLEDMQKNLADARQEAVDFGKNLAYSFDVSLAGAYATATASDQAYTEALQARSRAYDNLDIAKQGDDLNAYLKAVQDVAIAEQNVATATAARVTPTAAFAKQIEDAKAFGANLKALLGQGLGATGLSQLLGLGPTAGAEVTKSILEGTAGFTVGGLNASLADLASVQAGLAAQVTQSLAPTLPVTQAETAVAQAMSQVNEAQAGVAYAEAVQAGGGIAVTINTGVGDPVEIGRSVSDYLFAYDMRTGPEIRGGKKKKAKR